MRADHPRDNRALALVAPYEYKELPPEGESGSFWGRLPATMSLAEIDQDKRSGALEGWTTATSTSPPSTVCGSRAPPPSPRGTLTSTARSTSPTPRSVKAAPRRRRHPRQLPGRRPPGGPRPAHQQVGQPQEDRHRLHRHRRRRPARPSV